MTMTNRQLLALILAGLTLSQQAAFAAEGFYARETDYTKMSTNPFKVYDVPDVPPIDLANSSRLEELIQQGKIYLSLRDALALAIENNLDLEVARYTPLISQTDILRAKSGQQLRGVQTQISTLSTGLSVGGSGAGGGQATGITGRAGGTGGGGGGGGAGDASSFFGTQAVSLDPIAFAGVDWGHTSSPQTSDFVTGTNTLIIEDSNSNIGVRQGFVTGATATLIFASRGANTNSLRNNFNPSTRSNLTLQIAQPLLRGWGVAVNTRNIVVAKRNQQISDLAFKNQVIEVVTRVTNLYWDLVSLRAAADASRESLRLAQKLYDDNKRRVEIGTLAPIEIVRAEAEVAAREEELTIAETRIQLQETLFKNAISVNGVASPSLMHTQIIPTDEIQVPQVERIQPVEDLMEQALKQRPDVETAEIQLGSRDINLKAIRNARLPTVDLSVDLTNNGLAGQVNDNFVGDGTIPDAFFLGGAGSALAQIFRRNFPDYRIGVNVRIPLRNRQAQADLTATLLERRQAEIQLRQTQNGVRVEVQNAVIGVEQARARYDSSVKSRQLQEQTLAAEQKKFDLGASTIFLVVQAQRDLAIAKSQEIAAMNSYVIARTELQRSTGTILSASNISLDEAESGVVNRPADPIPVSLQQ